MASSQVELKRAKKIVDTTRTAAAALFFTGTVLALLPVADAGVAAFKRFNTASGNTTGSPIYRSVEDNLGGSSNSALGGDYGGGSVGRGDLGSPAPSYSPRRIEQSGGIVGGNSEGSNSIDRKVKQNGVSVGTVGRDR